MHFYQVQMSQRWYSRWNVNLLVQNANMYFCVYELISVYAICLSVHWCFSFTRGCLFILIIIIWRPIMFLFVDCVTVNKVCLVLSYLILSSRVDCDSYESECISDRHCQAQGPGVVCGFGCCGLECNKPKRRWWNKIVVYLSERPIWWAELGLLFTDIMNGKWRPFCLGLKVLTHWGRDRTDAIFQTTFLIELSWMKMCEFRLRLHWSLFLRVQLTKFQRWFR